MELDYIDFSGFGEKDKLNYLISDYLKYGTVFTDDYGIGSELVSDFTYGTVFYTPIQRWDGPKTPRKPINLINGIPEKWSDEDLY
jgi:hypothetical protein